MDNKRIVKLIPRKPLYGIRRTPITSCIERIDLTTEEIRLCLVTKCLVDEYLPDGTLLRLDLSNYSKNNSIVQDDTPIVSSVESIDNTDDVDKLIEPDILSTPTAGGIVFQDEIPSVETDNTDEIDKLIDPDLSNVSLVEGTVFQDDFTRAEDVVKNGWGEENPTNTLLNLSVSNTDLLSDDVPVEETFIDPVLNDSVPNIKSSSKHNKNYPHKKR